MTVKAMLVALISAVALALLDAAATKCPDGSTPQKVTTQIAASDDDAEEAVPGSTGGDLAVGSLYSTSSDIELGYDNDKYEGNQYVGLRFPRVAVPMGSLVHRAHVAFVVDAVGDCCNETFDVTVKMQKIANAPSLAGQPAGYLSAMYSGNATSGSVTYAPEVDEAIGDAASTPDLSALVQEVLGQDGWASGNAMLVLFGEATGNSEAHSREYESFDGAGGSAPSLVIEYCPMAVDPCPGGAAPKLAIARVAAAADDVEEAVPGATSGTVAVGELYTSSSDIELGYDKDKYTGNQYVGLRFTGLDMPASADVKSARVKFWVDAAGSCCEGDLSVTVKMQKAADAPAFTGQSSGYLDTLYTTGATAAEVTYTPEVDGAGDVHQPRYTPDLKDLLQEVVGLTQWAPGNAVVALFAPGTAGTAESNSREYESFDADPSMAASLVVEYCPPQGRITGSTSSALRSGLVGGLVTFSLIALHLC